PEPHELVNKVFTPIFDDQYRYYVLYGGRNSGKSFSVARRLIKQCLQENYFKCILIRNTFQSVKDSNYQNIVDDIYTMGFSDLFKITKNPLEIVCKDNSNKFLCRGVDNPSRIRSIANPTAVWYEEASEIEHQETFLMISTSLRSTKTNKLQEYLTFNPEFSNVGGYEEHWLYKMFFKEHAPKKTFDGKISIKLDNGKEMSSKYCVIHSTYKDNPYVTEQQKADLENFKILNSYYFQIFTKGNFGHKHVEGKFFKGFDQTVHVKKQKLNKDDILHVSFDENNQPFPAFQI
ncbi:unnamed protein product, partial [marine sediment metagenome]